MLGRLSRRQISIKQGGKPWTSQKEVGLLFGIEVETTKTKKVFTLSTPTKAGGLGKSLTGITPIDEKSFLMMVELMETAGANLLVRNVKPINPILKAQAYSLKTGQIGIGPSQEPKPA